MQWILLLTFGCASDPVEVQPPPPAPRSADQPLTSTWGRYSARFPIDTLRPETWREGEAVGHHQGLYAISSEPVGVLDPLANVEGTRAPWRSGERIDRRDGLTVATLTDAGRQYVVQAPTAGFDRLDASLQIGPPRPETIRLAGGRVTLTCPAPCAPAGGILDEAQLTITDQALDPDAAARLDGHSGLQAARDQAVRGSGGALVRDADAPIGSHPGRRFSWTFAGMAASCRLVWVSPHLVSICVYGVDLPPWTDPVLDALSVDPPEPAPAHAGAPAPG